MGFEERREESTKRKSQMLRKEILIKEIIEITGLSEEKIQTMKNK